VDAASSRPPAARTAYFAGLDREILEECTLGLSKRIGPLGTAGGLVAYFENEEADHFLDRDPPCRHVNVSEAQLPAVER
jgi:hypothetical protein